MVLIQEGSHPAPAPMNTTGGGGTALVLGATGETGKAVLSAASAARRFSKIIAPTRRKVSAAAPVTSPVYSDFNDIPVDAFRSVRHVFCCLGTTRAKAGSAEAFIQTDYALVMALARRAKDANVPCFHLVSAMGADPNSFLLYPQTKGRLEEDLKKLDFEQLVVYRPGMLLCDREERRFWEALSTRYLAPVLDYLWPQKYAIDTARLAEAMLRTASDFDANGRRGAPVVTLENKQICELVQ